MEEMKRQRLKFYQLENGSLVPLSDIRFTRCYKPYTIYGEKVGEVQYDVLLKSGPQFIVTKKEFDDINNIIKHEVEEVCAFEHDPFVDIDRMFELMKVASGRQVPLADYKIPEYKGLKPVEESDEESIDPDPPKESESDALKRYRDYWL